MTKSIAQPEANVGTQPGVSRAMIIGALISSVSVMVGLSSPGFATTHVTTKHATTRHATTMPTNPSATTDIGVDRYHADLFMVYEPHTLYDILEKIPGTNSLLTSMNEASQTRGFGSAGDQILINNKRVSGKDNSIQQELDNIQARDVDYIELIRGTRSDLDVQSKGLVINVVLKQDIDASVLWSVGTSKTSGMSNKPIASVVYSAGVDNIKYRVGLSHKINPTVISSTEHFTLPDQVVSHTDIRTRHNEYKEHLLTGKLEYLHSENTAVQLNGRFEKDYVDAAITNTINYWLTADQHIKSTTYDWDRDQWELSGDITHQWDPDNILKLLFISNRLDANELVWQVSSLENKGFDLPRLSTSEERVLRGSWKHQLDPRHSFDSGLEMAINSHDENLQLLRPSVIPYHSIEKNNIEETRYEAFINHNFSVTSDLNLLSSLIYEQSTMEVVTDLTLTSDNSQEAQSYVSRTFSYLKPRLNVRYDIDDVYQVRFNYERTVSQLNLDDFVPFYNSFESRLEETNPDLKPEVRDEFSFSVEKQWVTTDGSISLTPYYHRISDLRTEVLLPALSGDGNVDSGKEYGIQLDTHFGLEALGLENTLISASYTWRDSQMEHPFTRQNTPIERVSEREWNVKINHNELLPGLSFSLTLENKSPYQFYYYDYQGTYTSELSANAVIDYQLTKQLKLRLKGDDLLNDKYSVDKRRHTGLFSQSDYLRHEQRNNEYASRLTLTLTGQF